MALFPFLEIEKSVQVADKCRFHGGNSYVSKGSDAIASMTIRPGSDGSQIDVFNADSDERYLDWQFEDFDMDIDSSNNKLDFKESGSQLTATLSSGTYSLSELATEIETQLNAAGANTYTVSVSTDDKMTISATGAFSLLPTEGTNRLVSILPLININPKPGFGDVEYSGKTSITTSRIRHMRRAVTIEIGDGSTTQSKTYYIKVFSEAGDALFSRDADLISHADDVTKFLPEGKNSFLYMHRRSQDLILAHLDESGYTDIYGDPLTVAAITDAEEVRQWSTFLALRLIYDDLSNSPEDVFFSKARNFEAQEKIHKNRATIRLDVNKDGRADVGEGVKMLGGMVVRR